MKFIRQDKKVFHKKNHARFVCLMVLALIVAFSGFTAAGNKVNAAPVIISATLPSAQVNTPYTAIITAVPLTCPCTWSVTGGLLPPGLNLNPASGTITGTPTTSGTFPFFVIVTDTTGPSGPASFSITVSKPPIVINTYSLPQAKEGTPYTAVFSATGGTSPYNWTLSNGTLPAGLTIDPFSGVISGTPNRNTAGTYSFTLNITDTSSPVLSAQRSFNIFVEKGTFGATVSISNGLAAGTTRVTVDGRQFAVLKGGESQNLVLDLGLSKTVSVTPIVPHPSEPGVRFRATEDTITLNELASSANFTYFTEYEVKLDTAPASITAPAGSGWYRKDSNFTANARPEIPGDPGTQYKFNYWLLPNGNQVNLPGLSVTIDSPKTILANYDVYYQLSIQSPYGKTEGAAWYKAGTEANWSVTNVQVPMPGFVGFFQGKFKAVNPGGKVVIDSPKSISVLWEPDYTLPYVLIPVTILFLLGSVYGIYYFWRRSRLGVFQTGPIPPVPYPMPVSPPPAPPQHTTVVVIGNDKAEKKAELPASTKEQLMASFGQLLEKYETEVRSTLTPREPPKIETVSQEKMLESPPDELTIIDAEVNVENKSCNFASRKLLRTITGSWRQAASNTVELPHDKIIDGSTAGKTGLAVTWSREIYHEWEVATCSLEKNHAGKHKGDSEIVYSLMSIVKEDKIYGPGEPLAPPKPHVTDSLPVIDISEDQIIPADSLPEDNAR